MLANQLTQRYYANMERPKAAELMRILQEKILAKRGKDLKYQELVQNLNGFGQDY